MDDFIAKPVKPEQVKAVLRKATPSPVSTVNLL
jgi:hypothetical protein